MRRRSKRVVLGIAAVLGGCGGAGGGDDTLNFGTEPTSTATLTTTTPATESGSGSSESSSTEAPAEESSSGGSSSGSGDGSESSSTGALVTEPCTTLDVLVVIDDSDTMAEEQMKLTAALGPFFTLINTQLPGIMSSIQVGVITTSAAELVTSNPTMACTPYSTGTTWMAFGKSFPTELTCATAAGTMGDPDERPMQRAIEALSPELQGPGGVNEGLLRDTGPLVLIVVTDEEDDFEKLTEWGSEGDPADWVTAFAATQDDHVQDVIALALVGPLQGEPNACPPIQWNGLEGGEPAPRLTELTESFPHHAIGDICAAEYTTFFNAAVPEIVDACNAWVPE